MPCVSSVRIRKYISYSTDPDRGNRKYEFRVRIRMSKYPSTKKWKMPNPNPVHWNHLRNRLYRCSQLEIYRHTVCMFIIFSTVCLLYVISGEIQKLCFGSGTAVGSGSLPNRAGLSKIFSRKLTGGFFGLFSMYCCRPSDSTVSEDAGIEPRTIATLALAVRRSNH
jgi:hypothetical protein